MYVPSLLSLPLPCLLLKHFTGKNQLEGTKEFQLYSMNYSFFEYDSPTHHNNMRSTGRIVIVMFFIQNTPRTTVLKTTS